MKFVRIWIYNLVIFGLIFLIRLVLMGLFGLFMDSPAIISTVIAVIIVFGLSIWYIDWNMKR